MKCPMPRYLYTAILYFVLPFVFLRLIWRSRGSDVLKNRWPEYFGIFQADTLSKPRIWIHTVSLGETIAAAPLVKAIQAEHSEYQIVLTTTTLTGSERAKAIHGDDVFHVFAPYDLPGSVSRFLKKIRPEISVFMETELWPNIIAACHQKGIKTYLTNARMSERSARGYQKLSSVTHSMFSQLSCAAAQFEYDGNRLLELGLAPSRLHVTGTLKYDIQLEPSLKIKGQVLRSEWLQNKSDASVIFIAASTHKGEEELIIESFIAARQQVPELLLVLVPRHPERFNEVEQLVKKYGLEVVLRNTQEIPPANCPCIIGNTMGEMMLFYSASDIAFVGGSMIDGGGHNMLEPAAIGLPVICGSSVYNFQDIADKLESEEALKSISDSDELTQVLIQLCQSGKIREAMGFAALSMISRNRGALNRQLELFNQLLRTKYL